MNYVILYGSPRKNGNTQALTAPFIKHLREKGNSIVELWLSDMQIAGCTACRQCQQDWSKFGCGIDDDMSVIFEEILAADKIVLATPIYSWSCPAPMKAMLDRLVYGMNKYYGKEKGPALWEGKHLALITTCGYEPEKGSDLFETAMKRYCKHSQLEYDGMLTKRDLGYDHIFITADKIACSTEFAEVVSKK